MSGQEQSELPTPPVRDPTPAGPTPPAATRERIAWAAAAVLLVALVALSLVRFQEASADKTVRRFSFTPDNLYNVAWAVGAHGWAAVSPNGKHIAYLSGGDESAIWVRDIDREQARELPGTEGAVDQGLFWSPDSQFIGFGTGDALKKAPIQGGPVIQICATLPLLGGSWSPDGNSIAFGRGPAPARMFVVSADGGEPRQLFDLVRTERGAGNSYPAWLPSQSGRDAIVFDTRVLNPDIAVKNLETDEVHVLRQGAYPVYSPTGHIVYQTTNSQPGLWALPFSVEALRPTGPAFPITENGADPSVAADGTLVYVDFVARGRQQLVYLDRGGNRLGAIGQPQDAIDSPSLSPAGDQVVVTGRDRNNTDIWVHDIERGLKTRLTFHSAAENVPEWSPSGKEIAFSSIRGGSQDIFTKAAGGGGEAEKLIDVEDAAYPGSWSADGKYFVYERQSPGRDVWYIESNEQGGWGEARPFLKGPFAEGEPRLSANGRFLAYMSDESGRWEVYVQSFPSGDTRTQVSTNGGMQPRWSRDGKEVFYVQGETLMSAAVTTGEGLSAGSAKLLFRHPNLGQGYDVTADGKRFVVVENVESELPKPSIHIVQNWYEEFRDRARD